MASGRWIDVGGSGVLHTNAGEISHGHIEQALLAHRRHRLDPDVVAAENEKRVPVAPFMQQEAKPMPDLHDAAETHGQEGD